MPLHNGGVKQAAIVGERLCRRNEVLCAMPDTNCSSFVEQNATACHSERSEESPHLKAQSVRKMPRFFAEFTLSEANGLRMTDNGVILCE
jgi:hypothetical protein